LSFKFQVKGSLKLNANNKNHHGDEVMENTENNTGVIAKKPKKKALKIILGALILIILILIIGVIFAVPAYVSSESGKRLILSKANASGAGALDYANLSMSWGKGIIISNLSFKDKGQWLSVAVKGFSTKPNYGALLGGNLSFGETVVDEPKVEINVDKMKKATEEGKQKTESKEQKKERSEEHTSELQSRLPK
jgi:hypothetical protein